MKVSTVSEVWKKMPQGFKVPALGYVAYTASNAYPGTYLHELGHKVAADVFFKDAQARIEVQPFTGGGSTDWTDANGLTGAGEKIGSRAAHAYVAAAGPAIDLVSGMASFAAGYKLRKAHPTAGQALMGYGCWRVGASALYALRAVGGGNPNNDFTQLAQVAGIPPLVSAAVFAAALPLEYLVLKKLEDKEQQT